MCFTDRLWEDGWKDRYYSSKFEVDGSDQEFRQTVVNLLCLLVLALNICLKYYTLLCFLSQQLSVLNKVTYNMTVDFLQANHYVRGLCWVLRYYYQVKYFSSSDTYMYMYHSQIISPSMASFHDTSDLYTVMVCVCRAAPPGSGTSLTTTLRSPQTLSTQGSYPTLLRSKPSL